MPRPPVLRASAGRLRVGLGRPAQVLVDPDATATRLTLAAPLIAGGIDRRLWSQTGTGSVMACARHVAGTFQSEGRVQFRGGINVATSCPTLVKELYPRLEQRIRLKAPDPLLIPPR